ncbi:MAG: hypothetical protein L0Z50_28060 [Verrucomicrobiales bacterium]|nr:hypothetical protein [Verrucomicrobiales bacterium]
MKTRRCTLSAILVLFFAFTAFAAIDHIWSFAELRDRATLVVIATPIKVTATGQSTNIGVLRGKEIQTTFRVMTMLKGALSTNAFLLRHFSDEKPKQVYVNNSPRLVSFEPKDKLPYLMFLQREDDGRYAAVSGHWSPQDSILLLPASGFRASMTP